MSIVEAKSALDCIHTRASRVGGFPQAPHSPFYFRRAYSEQNPLQLAIFPEPPPSPNLAPRTVVAGLLERLQGPLRATPVGGWELNSLAPSFFTFFGRRFPHLPPFPLAISPLGSDLLPRCHFPFVVVFPRYRSPSSFSCPPLRPSPIILSNSRSKPQQFWWDPLTHPLFSYI